MGASADLSESGLSHPESHRNLSQAPGRDRIRHTGARGCAREVDRMRTTPGTIARGAAEAFGVMAAFVFGGLGLAAAERWAGPHGGPYPLPAMAAAADDPCEMGPADEPAAPAVWLVDGFNVLCAGVLRGRERSAFWSEASRQKLLERVARFEDADARVIVVFDGAQPPDAAPRERPETIFASSADDWIVARLRQASDERVTVVTADRQLAGRARHRGAEVVSPLRFLARCDPPCAD
jgi:predicted RNA-binding protein with PIN domain